MKRKVLLLFVSLLSFSAFTYAQEYEESEKKHLQMTNMEFGEHDRSGFVMVDAYIVPNQNLVEVIAFGIGNTEIYVVDAMGRVVDYTTLDSITCYATLPLPEVPGNYNLIVFSPTYYGEASFRVV